MGRRSATESVIAVLAQFALRRIWRQADLAREVGVSVPALRRTLDELAEWNVLRLEREESPPDVFYRRPEGWSLGSLALVGEEVTALCRVLARAPRSRERQRLLEKLQRRFGATAAPTATTRTPPTSPEEEAFLDVVSKGAEQHVPLRLRYHSTSRGAWRDRVVSVQRIDLRPPIRFIGYCHERRSPLWFRLDNVLAVNELTAVKYNEVDRAVLDRIEQETIGGFRADAPSVVSSFVVSDPDARWVIRNLPDGMRSELVDDGARVTFESGSLLRAARFVVGLGGAAKCETAALRDAVRELAESALTANMRSKPLRKRPAS